MRELSPEQRQIVDFAVNEPHTNLAIKALAGSGKTTTLVEIAMAKPRHLSAIAVAFARPNALDFKKVMPINVESGTMHSFGLRACNSWERGKCAVYGTNKVYKIADQLKVKLKTTFPNLPKIVGFAKSLGMVPYGALGEDFVSSLPVTHCFYEDTDANWMELFERLGAIYEMGENSQEDEDRAAVALCRRFLATSILWSFPPPGQKPCVDYDDMIYLPACFSDGEGLPTPKLLLVDEIQDLDKVQRVCIGYMGSAPKTQVILVGDPNQAIYAFRGADSDSFYSLVDQFDCTMFSLSYTFRSDVLITQEARTIVPEMDTFSDQAGRVEVVDEWQPNEIESGEAILCRNTFPLVGIFYKLIKHGVPAKIKGSEIGKGLITILRTKIKGETSRELRAGIDQWHILEANKAEEKGYKHKLGTLLEQASIFEVILARQTASRPRQGMVRDLEDMFSDKVAKVTLSTIHKAKGLEWDTVWFLDSGLIPSRYAEQEWEHEQETNLRYVAITRAKHNLLYVDSKGLNA